MTFFADCFYSTSYLKKQMICHSVKGEELTVYKPFIAIIAVTVTLNVRIWLCWHTFKLAPLTALKFLRSRMIEFFMCEELLLHIIVSFGVFVLCFFNMRDHCEVVMCEGKETKKIDVNFQWLIENVSAVKICE